MPKSIPALVTPKLLRWAREEAGFTIEDVAAKLKREAGELRAWESDLSDQKPTLRQAEQLAKLYHCSYAVLTLREPPPTTPLAKEYRRLPNVAPGKESPELRVALRDMLRRRQIALFLIDEIEGSLERFGQRASIGEDPDALSKRIRDMLNVSIETQLSWASDSVAWKQWRQAIEAQGVLVFVFPNVEQEEIRGVSLFHPLLPVIGVNSKEIPASRPFTLLHEFIHVLLANGNEEKPAEEEKRNTAEWRKLERFAERVAGGILLPLEALLQEELIQSKTPSSEWTVQEIRQLASRYKVTPKAFATRLLTIGKMSPRIYKQWSDEWNTFLKGSKLHRGGIATPAEKSLNRNGIRFTTLVIDALNTERVTPVEASHYLNIHYPHVEVLRLHFSFGRPLSIGKKKGQAA